MPHPAPKYHQRNRHETGRQAVAARANLIKASARERTMPRTEAQLAASRANIQKAIEADRSHPSAKLIAAEKAWEAKGAAAWRRGEAAWIAKGRAAWSKGAALWKLRGAAAWRSHAKRGATSGGGLAHGLRSKRVHALGTRIVPTTLRRHLPKLTIHGEPTRFASEISPTAGGSRTSWRRARRHHFRRHLHEHKPRRASIGHWRRTRKRLRAR